MGREGWAPNLVAARAPAAFPHITACSNGLPSTRAATTDWLAPLPPGALLNSLPMIVSPGAGMCGERTNQVYIDAADIDDTRLVIHTICHDQHKK
jgi:hypothetical protein